MITWKDEYALGVPIIDEQHRKLFEIAISIEELLSLPEGIDKFDDIMKIIDELKDYVIFHFNTEEGFMKKMNYPRYLSHYVQHQDFVENMNAINLEKIDDNQEQNLSSILNFVVKWTEGHILEKDRDWANYYHDNN